MPTDLTGAHPVDAFPNRAPDPPPPPPDEAQRRAALRIEIVTYIEWSNLTVAELEELAQAGRDIVGRRT